MIWKKRLFSGLCLGLLILWAAASPLSCQKDKPEKASETGRDGMGTQPSAQKPTGGTGAAVLHPSPEKIGENHRILTFPAMQVEREPTPGVLPDPKGSVGERPGDRSIRRVRYAVRLADDLTEINGLWIGKQDAPAKIEGRVGRTIRRVRAALRVGVPEAFGADWKRLRTADSGENPGAEAPGTEPPKEDNPGATAPPPESPEHENVPTSPEPEAETAGPKLVFEREFRLDAERPSNLFPFQVPERPNARAGDLLELELTILTPELDPTVAPIPPDRIGLVTPDPNELRRLVREIPALPPADPKRTVCYENRDGRMACFYESGAAELFSQKKENPIGAGRWEREGDILRLTLEANRPALEVSLADPKRPLIFGSWGNGWLPLKKRHERAHPYFDVAREINKEKAARPKQVRLLWRTQLSKDGEEEVIVRLQGGSLAVLERADAFSSYRLVKFFELKNHEVKIVWVPNAHRAFIAHRKVKDELWTVRGYQHRGPDDDYWSEIRRPDVPWKLGDAPPADSGAKTEGRTP